MATIPPSYSSDAYEPRNLAISPDGTGIAVPFRHSDNVWVIEKDTWTSVMVEDVSFYEPYAATYTLDGTEIWVVNKKGAGSSIGSITIINAASLQVIASIEDTSFSSPEGITVNDTHAFVVNKGDGSVARVNISTRLVDGLVNVGGEPRYAVVSPDNTFLYVSAPYSGIYKIRTSDLAILANYTESLYSRNMAISSDGSVVYTALQNNSILTIDTSSGNTSTISFTGAGSTYGVALIERTGRGYVTDEWWDRIYVFDLVSGQELPGELIDITELNTPRSIAGR